MIQAKATSMLLQLAYFDKPIKILKGKNMMLF